MKSHEDTVETKRSPKTIKSTYPFTLGAITYEGEQVGVIVKHEPSGDSIMLKVVPTLFNEEVAS